MKNYFEKELSKGGSMRCPCGCDAKMNKNAVLKLNRVREKYGKPIFVEQGATCEEYSVNKVGRTPYSTHIDNEFNDGAVGIDIKSKTFSSKKDYFDFLSIAIDEGFYGFGQGAKWIGAGTDSRLHIDTRKSPSGDVRSWCYGVKKH
jgi:hypothetical protein